MDRTQRIALQIVNEIAAPWIAAMSTDLAIDLARLDPGDAPVVLHEVVGACVNGLVRGIEGTLRNPEIKAVNTDAGRAMLARIDMIPKVRLGDRPMLALFEIGED